MGRPRSEFLSAFGTALEIWKKIVEAVMSAGGNDDDLRRLLSNPDQVAQIAQLIVKPSSTTLESYPISVDYNLSLVDMVAAGKYDWINPEITAKHFPIKGKGTVETERVLVHLNRQATPKQVEEHLAAQDLEPARIEHLLAFGAANPELQREFPIIALGSSWVRPDGDRDVPCLGRYGSERALRLIWDDPDDLWRESCRFLALRKNQPSGS